MDESEQREGKVTEQKGREKNRTEVKMGEKEKKRRREEEK